MKIILSFFLFTISSFVLSQPIYTIPWATDQPQWLFPIYIEDAHGQMDTIYFGFDPHAMPLPGDADMQFGEKKFAKDTNQLQAFIPYSATPDSDYKVMVFSDSSFFLNGVLFLVLFNNIYQPLTLKWDNNLLYSDSMPYPDQSPFPRAQGEVDWYFSSNYVNCGYHIILITDTIMPVVSGACVYPDSVLIENDHGFTGKTDAGIVFGFAPWLGYYPVGVIELKSQSPLILYPLPSKDEITVTSIEPFSQINCYDLFGKNIYYKSFNSNISKWTINLEKLESGIYFIKVLISGKTYSNKFLIIK